VTLSGNVSLLCLAWCSSHWSVLGYKMNLLCCGASCFLLLVLFCSHRWELSQCIVEFMSYIISMSPLRNPQTGRQ